MRLATSAGGGVLKSSLAGYFAFFVETAVGFAVSILLVRALDLAEFGAYKMAAAIITVGTYLTSCGLDASIQKFGAELIARHGFETLRRFLVAARLVRAVALLVFCGALLGFRDALSRFFGFPPVLQDLLLLVCGVLVVQSATGIFGHALFSARGAFVESSLLRATLAVLRLAGIGVVYWAGLGLFGVIGALFLAGALGFGFVVLRNRAWWRAQAGAAPATPVDAADYARRITRFTVIGYLAMNVNVFRDLSVDHFVIAHFLGVEQVAIYGLATTLFLFANALNPASLLRSVVTPLLVSHHARGGQMTDLQDAFRFLNKTVLLLHWPLVTALVVFGPPMIRFVYSPAYEAAYGPLLWLCGFGYFMGLTYPFVPLIAVLEKNILVLLSGMTAIYNLVLDVVLVPVFGVAGAAFATGSAALVQLALYWVAFRRVFAIRLSFPFAVLGRTLVNLLPPVALGLYLAPRVGSVVELLAALAGCGLLYAAALWWNHGLNASERALVGWPGRSAEPPA